MTEVWKDIAGFEGLYQISSKGRVKSYPISWVQVEYGKEHIWRRGEKYLKPCGERYKLVVLCKNKKHYTKHVHRLVAEAFIPNPDKLPCVDHIDTDRYNNCVENLRWVTHKQNNNNPRTLAKRSLLYKGEIAYVVAARNGISRKKFEYRLSRGWSVEDAVSLPCS